MNIRSNEITQQKYEELGHKIKDLNFEQTKSLNNNPNKFQTNTFTTTNNYNDENLKLQQTNLNVSLVEEESQVLTILKNLKSRHNEIENILSQKDNEKNAIMEDINILTQRMKMLEKNISKKRVSYENYDKTLRDAENAFFKINESTKTLLSVIKKENLNLTKITGLK